MVKTSSGKKGASSAPSRSSNLALERSGSSKSTSSQSAQIARSSDESSGERLQADDDISVDDRQQPLTVDSPNVQGRTYLDEESNGDSSHSSEDEIDSITSTPKEVSITPQPRIRKRSRDEEVRSVQTRLSEHPSRYPR